jgi:ABC-type sugar transport system permease subunit
LKTLFAGNGAVRRKIKPYLYIAPALICLFVFTVYPLLRQMYLSFFITGPGFSRAGFAGLGHYRAIVSNPVFWETVQNTLVFGSLHALLSTFIGLACALAVNSASRRLGPLFKAALVYPYMLPWTAAAMVWMYIFHPLRGIVNILLGMRIQWLNDYRLTLYVLIVISVWKTAGLSFLIFLSGLQNIPPSLYESLRLETGSRFKALRFITLPLLGNTFFTAVLLAIMGSFQSADLVYIITQGRPGNSTNVLIYYIYEQGIVRRNTGYGSALSTILFFVLLIFTVACVLAGERRISHDI